MQAHDIKLMFAGITDATKQILAKKLSAQLTNVIVGINKDIVAKNPADPLSVLTPPPGKILEAFRLCPIESTRVVIMGQDPYIKPGEAMGLSFSVTKGVTTPPSLRNIYKCLLNCGLIGRIPDHGDLSGWATQGVLLLNAALTTRLRESNAHAQVWSEYTDAVIKELSAKNSIIFILLGGFAQGKKSLVDKKHVILEWGHPSNLNRVNNDPANGANFLYCNVFSRANEHLRLQNGAPICWDPDASVQYKPACAIQECVPPSLPVANDNIPAWNNLSSREIVMVPREHAPQPTQTSLLNTPLLQTNIDPNGGLTMLQQLQPNVPQLQPNLQPTLAATTDYIGNACIVRPISDDDPQCYTTDTIWVFTDGGSSGNGKSHCKSSYGWYITNGDIVCACTGLVPEVQIENTEYKSSNNRGELTAILSAVKFLHANTGLFTEPKIMVVSDSEYSIKSITLWIYGWEKKPEKLVGKKNLDLITAAKDTVEALKTVRTVDFKHINSHTDEPADSDSEEWFMWKINDIVDKLCNKSLGRK
jgi:uracil-DNA glycosylase